ncbi:MAG: HAD family phosphatase [Chloroflexi bacterium]|nr:HAD family phosphatase [Chloroflexota bacterium]
MTQTQAVILDLDGLMVDSEPLHSRAFSLFLAHHGIQHEFTVEEYGKYFVGIPVADNTRWLIERFNLPMLPDAVLAQREAIYEDLIADPANLIAMPGVFDVLDELCAREVPLAVASGSPRQQVETILRGLGIAPRFRAVVAGTDVPRSKPAPDVYLRAAERLGVAPAQCVALEDSATGVTAAKAAGMRAIAVPNQYTAHQDLSHADARVDSLYRVMDWI